MVHHGNRGEGAGKVKVRNRGYSYLKLVDGSICHKLLTKSAEM